MQTDAEFLWSEEMKITGFQKKIITRAIDEPEKLTDWENQFIEDMASRGECNVSDKQNEILNRILHKLDFGD